MREAYIAPLLDATPHDGHVDVSACCGWPVALEQGYRCPRPGCGEQSGVVRTFGCGCEQDVDQFTDEVLDERIGCVLHAYQVRG